MPEQPCAFHPRRMTAVSCSNCGRPICPEDMRSAPVGYQCPICAGGVREGAFGAATYRAKAGLDRRINRLPMARVLRGAGVTQILIAANVAMFLGMLLTGKPMSLSTLLRFGALPPVLPRSEWWRIFTSMFVHFGFLHLAFNMYALFLFGPSIELRYGRVRFLALYLASGFLGGAFSLAFSSPGIAAGASGAVFGILGGWLGIFLRHRRSPAAAAQLRSILILIGINLALGATAQGIDNQAHLGGLVGGFVIASGLEEAARHRGGARSLAAAGSYAVVLVGAIFVLASATRFVS
jgi:membrane associated rhomboid family serine protease